MEVFSRRPYFCWVDSVPDLAVGTVAEDMAAEGTVAVVIRMAAAEVVTRLAG
jgi:hypothetical protein